MADEAVTRLAIVGGGNMGAALAHGLVAAGWPASELVVVEVDATRRAQLEEALPGVEVAAHPPAGIDAAVLAVKPADVEAVAAAAVAAGARRVLSIAAGVPLAAIDNAVGGAAATLRAMPNTPALVGQGASAVAAGPLATDEDVAWAERILSSVGTVVRVKETDLDAVTGLSGSGPAYLFLVAEALVDAGVEAGLTRVVSEALVRQLLVGSAALLARGHASPATLRAEVTSPGGTTAAGLRQLERAGVRSAFLEAVAAATERSRELGATGSAQRTPT